MNNFDYAMRPINKTASLVTAQSGCATDGTLSDEQIRENLVLKITNLKEMVAGMPKGVKKRKALGLDILEAQKKLSEINAKIKGSSKDIHFYIIDILREELTEGEFKELVKKARVRAKESA